MVDYQKTLRKVLIALAIFGIPQLLILLQNKTGEWALLGSALLYAIYDILKHWNENKDDK